MSPNTTNVNETTRIDGNCLINTKRVPNFQQRFFDPLTPELAAQKVSSGGRQSAWFVSLPSEVQAVLRHYRRGGLIAKLIHNQYVWTGASRTRSWAEYQIMLYLSQTLDCVPAPLAASYQRVGLLYRAAILVERIPQVQPLADVLSTADPDAVATAIRAMHDAGVWHADLNAYNILLNESGQAWIIDFDRARRVIMTKQRRQSNLYRLRRSLVKVQGEQGFAWWTKLSRAYLQHPHAISPNRN